MKHRSKAEDIWADAPGGGGKEVDTCWTVKFRQGGGQDIAIPVSGYKSHIAIDRR